jgi:hypothetical protein
MDFLIIPAYQNSIYYSSIDEINGLFNKEIFGLSFQEPEINLIDILWRAVKFMT